MGNRVVQRNAQRVDQFGAAAPEIVTVQADVGFAFPGPDIFARLEKDMGALEGATAMPCSGRCDDPIPLLSGHDTLVGLSADTLEQRASPLPPPPPDWMEFL